MSNITQMTDALCDWYGNYIIHQSQSETLEVCELLLCASDLNLDSPVLQKMLSTILSEEERQDFNERPVLHSIIIRIVFTKYDVADKLRCDFLKYWFSNGRFQTQGIFMAGALVNLALQNKQLLDVDALERARKWYFVNSKNLKSDKLAAWAPFCLLCAGYSEEAKNMLKVILARREKDGSWGQELKRTIGCAYGIALSGLASSEELSKTVEYIASRFANGMITEISLKAQILRLLQLLGMLPEQNISKLRNNISKYQKVFISYSRKDIEIADQIVEYLGNLGYAIWIDRSGITLGDEWPEKLAVNMNESDTVLILISKHSLDSEYCAKEILYALKRKKPVLALHLDSSILPDKIDFMLGDIQRITLSDYDSLQEGLKILDDSLQKIGYTIEKRD